MYKTLLAVPAILVTLVLSGCGSSSPTASAPAQPKDDILAKSSCEHFRNVASDATKGLLTDAELRVKLKEVYGDAQYATSDGIASGAQEMLSAITSGDSAALSAAITAFDLACKAAGH